MADVDYALKFGAMQLQNQIVHDKGMSGKKGKVKGKNKDKQQTSNSDKTGDFQIDTTLHGYPMIGPFTPGQKDVWYCDNSKCQYTQHGVYRRYKIQNWRSSQFGKKFVLCDGCVRQYQKIQPIQQQQQQQQQINGNNSSNVNVKVNMNIPPQPGAAVPQYNIYSQQQANGQYINYGMQQQIYQQNGIQQPVFSQQYQHQHQQQQPQQIRIVKQPTQLDEEEKTQENEGISGSGIQIIKQGWMMKKGDIVKSWKKRYFVLKSNQTLNYYESDNAIMVKGTCQLNKVKSVKKKSTQSFEVQTPKRKWCFACKDEITRDEWVNKIRKVAGNV